MKCPICHEPVGGVGEEVELLESRDGLSAWIFHPNCYDRYESNVLANQQARQAARQRKVQVKLKRWNSLASK